MTAVLAPPGHSLPCVRCGAETNAEYRPDPDSPGDRIPVWRCLNLPDCGHLDY